MNGLWLGLTLVTFALHLATSGRYGYFRDELYFIACARHLAWGYVDQPPLVAVAAWLAGFFDYALVAMRILPILASAATVWLTCRVAQELGGGRYAQLLAGLGAMLFPAYLLLGNTLTTTSFEPFSWTLVAFLLIRIIRTANQRLWLAVGLAVAFGLYGKYSMLLLVAALIVGLAASGQLRIMRTPWFAVAGAMTIVLTLPNVDWQFAQGWPMLTVLHGNILNRHAFQSGVALEYQSVARNAIAFIAEQPLYANPVFTPVWLVGLVAFFRHRDLGRYRVFGMAYIVLVMLAVALNAKGYYIIGIYGVLVAGGAVALEGWWHSQRLRRISLACAVALSLPLVPMSLPVLPVQSFIAYTAFLRLTGINNTEPRLIQPLYAEEFGWEELAQHVADVYNALPPGERAETAIFADTYGDAGALAFFGPRYGLPPVISGQNTFYLWGTGGYSGRSMIAVGAMQAELLKSLFTDVRLATRYVHPYKWVVEGPDPIWICRRPRAPLSQLWPRFQWYGA